MSLKTQLAEQLTSILEKIGIHDLKPQIDYPASPEHGDFSTNVAMMAAKKAGKNPRQLAEEIANEVRREEGEGRSIEKVEIAGPGFINFWIKDDVLMHAAFRISNSIHTLADAHKGKVIVEYSSPNIAKPFTVGHLRSTIIGDAVANLLQSIGWKVFRDNHIGDWGTQFGKQIYAIKAWGDIEKIEKSERPVKLLVELYVKFHDEAEKQPELEDEAREWFRKLEEGDSEARELWQKCIDWSWKEFDTIYKQLGVTFSENNGRGYGESFFEDKMTGVIQELKDKHLLQAGKEGAQIVEFPEASKLPPLMILKKDGATLYATRDLATDKFRLANYGKDVLIINEVGAEQSLYMQQIYLLEQMLGWVNKSQRVHIRHGLYRFKEGKMSTRKGNVIWLEEVLEEAVNRAWNLQKHETEFSETEAVTTSHKEGKAAQQHVLAAGQRMNIATTVGIGAIKWNDLKRSPEQDIVFDWDEILNMQGNSGPYVQYTYARTQSVLRKAEGRRAIEEVKNTLNKEEREVLRLVSRFSDTVVESAERYAPNLLCTYLFELAQAFNLFYQKHQILKADEETRDIRLQLTASTAEVLSKGLNLLGIQAPEKM